MTKKKTDKEKFDPLSSPTLKSWGDAASLPKKDVVIECGWGRLIFAHTFEDKTKVADVLRQERKGTRDIALYLRDPQVIIAKYPHDLFIDPSYTYRLWLEEFEVEELNLKNFRIGIVDPADYVEEINRIYSSVGMVPIKLDLAKHAVEKKYVIFWIAFDNATDEPIGIGMGVDHKIAFDDPENGSSLWALAVDQRAIHAGIGTSLVKVIISHFKNAGRKITDVSVMHNNRAAIALYEKLGYKQVPVFCVKNKNVINENLYIGPEQEDNLNPYSRIIINEAKRRGIRVHIIDAEHNFFRLTFGGSSIVCRESLSELTSAIAMTRCMDKEITHHVLSDTGLNMPAQKISSSSEDALEFLKEHGSVVVKPAFGEQGVGITVNVKKKGELNRALQLAKLHSDKVILEEMVEGTDLRIIVINFEVVAAAIRKPPVIVGDGKHTIEELITKLSRRRQHATDGESSIPIDDEVERVISEKGYRLGNVLPAEQELAVRKTSNLHTGATIHDVTSKLHPKLIEVAKLAAKVINIPVVGLDLIVKDVSGSDYVIIEANERPGLANHEPQPTAQKFIDMLFPQSINRQVTPNR